MLFYLFFTELAAFDSDFLIVCSFRGDLDNVSFPKVFLGSLLGLLGLSSAYAHYPTTPIGYLIDRNLSSQCCCLSLSGRKTERFFF